MLKLVTAIAVFVAVMAFAAVVALLMGLAFSALTQSQWWKNSAAARDAETGQYGSANLYGEQGDQRAASFGDCSFGGTGDGCDSGSIGS